MNKLLKIYTDCPKDHMGICCVTEDQMFRVMEYNRNHHLDCQSNCQSTSNRSLKQILHEYNMIIITNRNTFCVTMAHASFCYDTIFTFKDVFTRTVKPDFLTLREKIELK